MRTENNVNRTPQPQTRGQSPWGREGGDCKALRNRTTKSPVNFKTKNRLNLNIIHFNTKGLANEERLYEFEAALENISEILWG